MARLFMYFLKLLLIDRDNTWSNCLVLILFCELKQNNL